MQPFVAWLKGAGSTRCPATTDRGDMAGVDDEIGLEPLQTQQESRRPDEEMRNLRKVSEEMRNKRRQFFESMMTERFGRWGGAAPGNGDDVDGTLAERVRNRCEGAPDDLLERDAVLLTARHGVNEVVMTRVFPPPNDARQAAAMSDEAAGMVDAVLHALAGLKNVPLYELSSTGQFMPAYTAKPIQMTPDIYCRIEEIVKSGGASGPVESVRLRLASNTISATEIAAYVRRLYGDHVVAVNNSVGDNTYIFERKARNDLPPPRYVPGVTGEELHRMKHQAISRNPERHLSWTMKPFYSNKRFSNIYGAQIRAVVDRIRFFLDNRDWYDSNGVAYQLGIMLSGVPGAGKTSIIRALANHTGRHIVTVNFAEISTVPQLRSLFTSDLLAVYTDPDSDKTTSVHVPIHKRIYVLEEIDAIGDVVKRRDLRTHKDDSWLVPDEITLADILTVLDGTMETPGRIIVLTTNHPEVLDPALVRAGRVDVRANLGYADRDQIVEMFEAYLGRPFPADLRDRLPQRHLSPAEVGQVLVRHFNACEKDDDAAIVGDLVAAAEEAVAAREPPMADDCLGPLG